MKTSIIIFLSVLTISATSCFAEETKTISGYIAEIDDVGSKLIVNTGTEAMPFVVADDASITRGTEDISLTEIEINDPVTINYHINSDGKNEITSIIDSNLANE